MKSKMAMQAYRNADREAAAESNEPHALISVLLAELLRHIRSYIACVTLPKADRKKESEHLAKSLMLIYGLQSSLNFEQGGQIADNLFRLYEYARQQLLKASKTKEVDGVEAAAKALEEINEAWSQIQTKAADDHASANDHVSSVNQQEANPS